MNKHIAKQLNEIAATTPTLFSWTTEQVMMFGWELNLTPLGDEIKFEKEAEYPILVPMMVAVDHKQQFKDAYKRGGWEEVKAYHKSVIDKIRKNEPSN
jgi:hypothetical protein